MTLLQLSNLQHQIESYIRQNTEPTLTITGDDTVSGGYRLIIPNPSPDVCGDLVRAIAPGENMNISINNNTLTLNSATNSVLFGSVKGGGQIRGVINSFAIVTVTWSDPLIVDLEDGNSLIVPAFSQLGQYRIPFSLPIAVYTIF